MKKLLQFILENGLGIKDYQIKEEVADAVHSYQLIVPTEIVGLIIGKKGRTVKMIRNILKVRAILDKIRFSLIVSSD